MDEVANAVKRAYQKYDVVVLHDNEWGLIDNSTAEPEVNWPGELIGRYESGQEAWNAKWQLIADAAVASFSDLFL